MSKKERQEKIMEIIRAKAVTHQQQLLAELRQMGIMATQSSISRDLAELGVVKLKGVYRLPHLEPGESPLVDLLDLDTAGDHLIVVKTGSGQASVVAERIDQAKIPEIVGTLAGENTVFVAVKGHAEQSAAMKQILALFHVRGGSLLNRVHDQTSPPGPHFADRKRVEEERLIGISKQPRFLGEPPGLVSEGETQ